MSTARVAEASVAAAAGGGGGGGGGGRGGVESREERGQERLWREAGTGRRSVGDLAGREGLGREVRTGLEAGGGGGGVGAGAGAAASAGEASERLSRGAKAAHVDSLPSKRFK